MRRRDNTGRRRAPRIRPYTVLVYCGAVRTEPDYFEGLRAVTRNAGVTVKLRQDGIAPAAYVPAYDKRRLDFAHYAAGVDDAVKRAKDLDSIGTDHERNPSTSVWRLVEVIKGGS